MISYRSYFKPNLTALSRAMSSKPEWPKAESSP